MKRDKTGLRDFPIEHLPGKPDQTKGEGHSAPTPQPTTTRLWSQVEPDLSLEDRNGAEALLAHWGLA